MIYLNTHLFLYPLIVRISSYPSKKKQLFFIHFAFMYPFQKKCCIGVDIYLLLDKVRKKEKNTTPMVLHVYLTNERMNNIIVVTVGKKLL